MKERKIKPLRIVFATIASLLVSVAGVYFIPSFCQYFMGTEKLNITAYTAGIVLCFLGALISAVFMYTFGEKRPKRFWTALARMLTKLRKPINMTAATE